MQRSILMVVLAVAALVAACDRQPTVVTVPGPTVAVPVPGPAGPAGPAGASGDTGATGTSGTGTTVVITPPAPAASN